MAVRIVQLNISRFRGIETLSFEPGPRNVILGPQNAGKSTILEALDLLLHHGLGRSRRPPTEIDYFGRDPEEGFEIEAVLGSLDEDVLPSFRDHLEGWKEGAVVPAPDGTDIETVVRVRVRGTADFTFSHEFSKPESEGTYFNPARRAQIGWVFDGRLRNPVQQLSFYQGGLLEKLCMTSPYPVLSRPSV